jgi:hypothetical protein
VFKAKSTKKKFDKKEKNLDVYSFAIGSTIKEIFNGVNKIFISK